MPESRQQNLWPGWQTVKLIGRGSFGEVYELQRDVLGDVEKAALKVISVPQNNSDIDDMYGEGYDEESITSTFQSHLKSIVAEYSLMRKMNGCINIVNCDDIRYIQHEDGIGWDIFIKMELLTPLMKALPAEVPEETAIRVGKDICAALEICKEYDIVHRDIKPQNIFVSSRGDYKLGDFGIAKTVEKTMGGTKIGTYKYMAPEVYNNQPYGTGADIYSLGLVLYWLLNEKRMPFLPLPPAKQSVGMEEEARNRRFRGEPLPEPAHGSEELKRIVLKACAYDPKARYQSATEMLAELNGLSQKQPVPVPVPTPEPEPAPTPEPAPAHEPIPVPMPAPMNESVIEREETKQENWKEAVISKEIVGFENNPGLQKPQAVFDPLNGGTNNSTRVNEEIISRRTNIRKRVVAFILFAILLIVHISTIEFCISRIIIGNIMIYAKCEETRPAIKSVNAVLIEMIDARKDVNGMIVDRNGSMLNPSVASTSIGNAILLFLQGLFITLAPLGICIYMAVKWIEQILKRKGLRDSKSRAAVRE